MIHCNKIVLFFLLFSLSAIKIYSQNLFDYPNSIKYANYLFQNKQFQLSAIEYERIAFMEPKDTLTRLRLIQSYRLFKDFETASERLQSFLSRDQIDYPEDFAIEKFTILFQEMKFKSAYDFLQENKTIPLLKKKEFELGTLLMQSKWNEAKVMSERYITSEINSPKIKGLYNISLNGMDIKYKNPGFSAILSTLIPGLGKVYTNRIKDAVFSFLFISATSYLTYNSINNYGFTTSNIIFGSLTISLYSANVYGSYKSATEFNRKANMKVTKEIDSILFEN